MFFLHFQNIMYNMASIFYLKFNFIEHFVFRTIRIFFWNRKRRGKDLQGIRYEEAMIRRATLSWIRFRCVRFLLLPIFIGSFGSPRTVVK